MPRTATPCTVGSCRRNTRDSSGRCHDHRSASPASSSHPLPSPVPVTPTSQNHLGPFLDIGPRIASEITGGEGPVLPLPPGVTRSERDVVGDEGVRTEVVYTDGVTEIRVNTDSFGVTASYVRDGEFFRGDGGPTEVSYNSDGLLSESRWFTGTEFAPSLSRLDGPSYISHYSDGSVYEESYYRNGHPGRLGGPAYLEHARDGAVVTSSYSFPGIRDHFDAEGFYAELAKRKGEDFRKWFTATPLEAVEPGREHEVVDAYAAGVRTPEGILEVLAGAPPEWVRAYEESGDTVKDTA